jgi:hypothetical protein
MRKPHDEARINPSQTGNDVTSHRNVTAIVDLKPELNPVANIRRPRFSFSLFNCQKTDGQNRPKPLPREPEASPPETPNPPAISQRNFRASSSVASSAAALVGERFIVPPLKRSQQLNFKKINFLVSDWYCWDISAFRPTQPESSQNSRVAAAQFLVQMVKSRTDPTVRGSRSCATRTTSNNPVLFATGRLLLISPHFCHGR